MRELPDDLLLYCADIAEHVPLSTISQKYWRLLQFRYLRNVDLTDQHPDISHRLKQCAGRVVVLRECIIGNRAWRALSNTVIQCITLSTLPPRRQLTVTPDASSGPIALKLGSSEAVQAWSTWLSGVGHRHIRDLRLLHVTPELIPFLAGLSELRTLHTFTDNPVALGTMQMLTTCVAEHCTRLEMLRFVTDKSKCIPMLVLGCIFSS
jgi:hypothetical protein